MGFLQVDKLVKSYGNKKVLDEFSMEIHGGEIVGLIGRNGAGKTTLLNCIAGNIFPDSGVISFEHDNLLKKGDVRKDFGILIQGTFLEYLNTYDNLKLLQNAVGIWDKKLIRKRSDELLKMVGLENKGNTYVKSFSFGMKQRLGFAQALLNGNKFIILDEPFVGLDMNGREMVKEHLKKIVKEKQIGVLFSDHNLDEVRSLCDRVIVIKSGKKIYDEILSEEKQYEIYVEKLNQELVQSLSNILEVHMDRQQNRIKFENSKNIHKIMEIIVSNTNIVDMKVYEDKLENMMRGE